MEQEKTNTKETILLKALELGFKKGFCNVSLMDIATEVGIKKASLYSHYDSKNSIISGILGYCKAKLAEKNFAVNFKAKDAQELLFSLVDSFMETFGEAPLSQYYAIIQQQKLYTPAFNEAAHEIAVMVNARVKVALEYCVQRSWLDIPDTDIASGFFSDSIQQCLTNLVASENLDLAFDAEWELNQLVDGLISLFS